MWYLIAGKIMYILVYSILFKMVINFQNLSGYDQFFGWFLIEHIFEYYNQTAGKFFMVNEDFRRLVKNSFIVLRNLIFWVHFLTFIEFFLLIFLACFLLYFTFYFYSFLKITENKNYTIKNLIYILYYLFFILILNMKLYGMFSLLDLYMLGQPILLLISIIFSCYYFYTTIFIFVCYFCKNLNETKKYKYLLIKFLIHLLIIFLTFFLVFEIILLFNKYTNNFIQEFIIQILLIYTYCYYT